jgi:hypothetical protein
METNYLFFIKRASLMLPLSLAEQGEAKIFFFLFSIRGCRPSATTESSSPSTCRTTPSAKTPWLAPSANWCQHYKTFYNRNQGILNGEVSL